MANMTVQEVAYPITNKYTFACVFSKPENVRPYSRRSWASPSARFAL